MKCDCGMDVMVGDEICPRFRFRGLRGVIYSNNPEAFEPRVTQSRVKDLLNDLYAELAKHDPAKAEEICKARNA